MNVPIVVGVNIKNYSVFSNKFLKPHKTCSKNNLLRSSVVNFI